MNTRKRPIVGVLRTKKVLMLLTPAQKALLKGNGFWAVRWVYNITVATIEKGCWLNPKSERVERVRANERLLRDKLREELREDAKLKPEDRRLPAAVHGLHGTILAYAVKDACDAYNTNFDKMGKTGQTYKFNVRYRSFKAQHTPTEIIHIQPDASGKNCSPLRRFEAVPKPVSDKRRDTARAECLAFFGGNLKGLGGVRLQDKPEVIGLMLSEGKDLREHGKIHWDKRTDSFHFIYCHDMPVAPDPDPAFEKKRMLAGDMGVAPPIEWYQPDGSHGAILEGFPAEVKKRCLALDALQSRIDGRSTTKRPDAYRRDGRKRRRTNRRLRKKIARDRIRLTNHVANAHYDAANFMLERADIVIVPRIDSKRLSERAFRNMRSGTVRTMLTISPGKLCERLHSAAARYAGRHVFTDTGEPGTTMTRVCCGYVAKVKLGQKKIACPRCGLVIDRQVNGAVGNFYAAIGKAVGIGWDGNSM